MQKYPDLKHLSAHARVAFHRSPLFVTIKKKEAQKLQQNAPNAMQTDASLKEAELLRGCIGCLSPVSVSDSLGSYALSAAFSDHRFDPITLDELPECSCTVSFLVDFEPGQRWDDWDVGTHGIWITLSAADGSECRAVFLPEVAVEQQWSKLQTVKQLIQKAGYTQEVTQSTLASLSIERFKSSKASVSWQGYRKNNS
jgi:uncharacterized protein (TIGR00296 family)